MKLEITNLGKRFLSLRGAVDALSEINLTVDDGEFFVLLGPSGCGKSTLLSLIAGLERPSAGRIGFDGRCVASAGRGNFLSPGKRNVAMVFQSYALYPHMSVSENIAFPLRIAGRPKKEIGDAVLRTATDLGIEQLLEARPAELSGGQKQRTAIARALVRRPEIFLLDEPLSNLDAQLRASTRTLIKSLQRRLGITTVYVTHDQTEAMSLGDRIAVLRNGRVEQVGVPEELYGAPATSFVASFVGSPSMNLLDVNWEIEGGKSFIFMGDQRLELPEAPGRKVRGLETGRCLFGIRPEDINLKDEEQGLRGTVETVEPLGREDLVHLRIDGRRLALLSRSADLLPGREVTLSPNLEKCHIFPAEGVRQGRELH